MSNLPPEILEAVKAASRSNPNAPDAAVSTALGVIKSLPGYGAYVEKLVHNAIQLAVYAERARYNRRVRKEAATAGAAVTPLAKVDRTASRAVRDSYDRLFNYCIAGTTLGALRGEQLAGVAEGEERRAEGHTFNARLCRELARLVPDHKTVAQSVSGAQLQKLFTTLLPVREEVRTT